MFLSVTVTKNQKNYTDVGARMIRAESLYALQVNGTGAKFTYPINYRDRRTENSYLETTDSVATIKAAMILAYTDGTVTLDVYPDNNTSLAVVSTIFDVTSIQWGIASGATDTYLLILEGAFKVHKVLVKHTIAQILALSTP